MPSDMRLQCPSEDTPPSTRPPSVASSGASTSGTPHRSTSMDSLHTNSSTSEKPSGEEYIPTRLIRPTPKVNANAMQFVKTGPALLHKSAKEQMKKVEVVKSLRKSSLQEEEDWQSSSSSGNMNSFDNGSDWQSNLDKWKSSRRKRNEDVLERVIEVKKNEFDEEYSKTRRRSKTFSEMREEKSKRGRRYNLVVHDDDNNDLSDLGLSTSKNGQSLSDAHEEGEAKSDAGFCTGSDTGSDGVFAEDNISDTSSALGDKREIHDSLLESASPPTPKKDNGIVNGLENGHATENSTTTVKTLTKTSSTVISSEYTYDKAIEDYKQFAENSAKKRTSSVTSLSSNASGSKEEHENKSMGSKRIEEKFSFYEDIKEPKVIRRERNTSKIDIDKRRSMFELRNLDQQETKKSLDQRKSFDVSSSLKSKVASFENINDSENRARVVKPFRDTKFKEKLASFNKNSSESNLFTQRKTPERDQNFYQKLQNFTQMESKSVSEHSSSRNSSMKVSPERKHLWKSSEGKLSSSFSYGRGLEKVDSPSSTPLKERIASFENLSPDHSRGKRELSVSMENLNENKTQTSLGSRTLQASQSVSNLFRRTPPTTPYMVVEVDEEAEEKSCVKRNISRDFEVRTPQLEKKLHSTAEVDPIPPPLPEKPNFKQTPSGVPELLLRTSRTLPETPKESSHVRSPTFPSDRAKSPRKLPQVPVASQKPEEHSSPSSVPKPALKIPDVVPTSEEKLLNWPLQTSSETPLEPPPHTVPEVAPPPIPPPRIPSFEDEYTALTSFITEEEESKDNNYSDEDIDEEIENDSLQLTTTSEKLEDSTLNKYIRNSDLDTSQSENQNEHTQDPERSESHEIEELSRSSAGDDIVRSASLKSSYSPSPTVPHKSKNLAVFEVIDVTWTDNNSSPAAPPSVPPPPPPPEEEGEEDGIPDEANEVNGGGDHTLSNSTPAPMGLKTKPTMSSPQSAAQELRKMRSDFLGTNPQVEQELAIQPPPDLNELLRQEREAERKIIQKQASLKREQLIYDSDSSYSSSGLFSGRQKYTWEDRVKADEPKSEGDSFSDSVDTMEFHTFQPNSSKSLHALKTYQEYASKFSAFKHALSEGKIKSSSSVSSSHGDNSKVVSNDTLNSDRRRTSDSSSSSNLERKKYFRTSSLSNNSKILFSSSDTDNNRDNSHKSNPLEHKTEEISKKEHFNYKGNSNLNSSLSSQDFSTVNNKVFNSVLSFTKADEDKDISLTKNECKTVKPHSRFQKDRISAGENLPKNNDLNLKIKTIDIKENSKETFTYEDFKPEYRSRSSDKKFVTAEKGKVVDDDYENDFRFLGRALNKQMSDIQMYMSKFNEKNVDKKNLTLDRHIQPKISSARSEEDLTSKSTAFESRKHRNERNISKGRTYSNLDKSKSSSFSFLPMDEKIGYFEMSKNNSKSLAELNVAESSYKNVDALLFPSYMRKPTKKNESSSISSSHSVSTPNLAPKTYEEEDARHVESFSKEEEPLSALFARNLDKVKRLLSSSELELRSDHKKFSHSVHESNQSTDHKDKRYDSIYSSNTHPDSKSSSKSPNDVCNPTSSSPKEQSSIPSLPGSVRSFSTTGSFNKYQSSLNYNSNASSKLGIDSFAHAYGGGSSQVFSSLTLKEDYAKHKIKKLAELEQEMEKHDRVMLQRVQGSSLQDKLLLSDDETLSDISSNHLPYAENMSSTVEAPPLKESNNNRVLPQTQNTQPCANGEIGQHRRVQESYTSPFFKQESTQSSYSSSESSFNSRHKNSQESVYNEGPSVSREIKKVVGRESLTKSLSDAPPPVPRKQSILALSAIPKPKLTDNESWIMKRKTETNKKDYSKHWLIQEAEQRRLEQQERISRPHQMPLNKQINLHTTSGYQAHFQNIKSSFNSSSPNNNNNQVQNIYSNTSVVQNNPNGSGFNRPSSPPTRSSSDLPNRYINNNNEAVNNVPLVPSAAPNNNWMKQTKTYQPEQPSSPPSTNSKPLPDAIISTITQRVNNKLNNNSNSRTPIYNSLNATVKDDENYHDYMNTGSLNLGNPYNNNTNNNKSVNGNSPVGSPTGTPGQHFSSHLPPAGQQGQVEDKRLLSVSGKKKCSHCGEELGRGAAMIIESLRLFYHIPCFKCCVCGIQLGNGTSGADVRVRNHKLHCHNCYSNDEGMKFSKV